MEIKHEKNDEFLNCVFIEEDYSIDDQFDPLSCIVKKEETEEVDVKPDFPFWDRDPDESVDFKDPPPPDDDSNSTGSFRDSKEELKVLVNDAPATAAGDETAANEAADEKIITKKEHKCPDCGKVFDTSTRLKRHLGSHEKRRLKEAAGATVKKPKNKICQTCGKAFATNQKLNRHIATHAKHAEEEEDPAGINRMHKCPKCGKGFSYPSTLKRHIDTHTDDDGIVKLFQCRECSRFFPTKLKLELHQQLHTDKALICNICSKRFTKIFNLEAHILRHTTEGKFLCEECGRKFNSDHNLRTHIFRIHNPRSREETAVLCNLCGKAFFDQKAFERHEVVHTDVRTVPCPLCPMMFKTAQNRNIHMTIHTGEKPHACKICGKAFRRYSWLKTHMFVHGNDRKDCPYCKTCTKSIYLRKHIVTKHRGLPVHITDGPMGCTICKEVFATLNELKDHVEVHSTCEELPDAAAQTETPKDSAEQQEDRQNVQKVPEEEEKGIKLVVL
ncbi:zinc finger protein 235-like [Lutzomyia longipalpis]|uniref:zinc finger protein 235-like n=1 Tax=Lutzomyia longipalpis TaxID=7200 RepID=UPI00248468FC|nr:zinc finger protein 235-like [Lutzomyia longipalpis]